MARALAFAAVPALGPTAYLLLRPITKHAASPARHHGSPKARAGLMAPSGEGLAGGRDRRAAVGRWERGAQGRGGESWVRPKRTCSQQGACHCPSCLMGSAGWGPALHLRAPAPAQLSRQLGVCAPCWPAAVGFLLQRVKVALFGRDTRQRIHKVLSVIFQVRPVTLTNDSAMTGSAGSRQGGTSDSAAALHVGAQWAGAAAVLSCSRARALHELPGHRRGRWCRGSTLSVRATPSASTACRATTG